MFPNILLKKLLFPKYFCCLFDIIWNKIQSSWDVHSAGGPVWPQAMLDARSLIKIRLLFCCLTEVSFPIGWSMQRGRRAKGKFKELAQCTNVRSMWIHETSPFGWNTQRWKWKISRSNTQEISGTGPFQSCPELISSGTSTPSWRKPLVCIVVEWRWNDLNWNALRICKSQIWIHSKIICWHFLLSFL